MGEAFLDYKKGGAGLDINGIIEDYYVYAGENVNAGDFIEFVNGVAGKTVEASENASVSETAYYGYQISACKLSETSVFIAHGTDDAVSQSYLHGVVCKIEGTKIISGVSTQISSNRYSARSIVTITLDKDRVLVLHSYNDNYRLYSSICEISGTTISVTAAKQLSSTSNSGALVSACKLSETSIFIAHGDSTNYNRLYGVVATVSGTTITAGTDTQLSTTQKTSSCTSTVSLSANKVFIAHSYDSTNMYLYGMVCTVSGTTISHGTDTALQKNTWAGGTISAEALDGNRVFIAHTYDSYSGLWGMVCTISGTSVTAGTDTTISSLTNAEKIVSTILLKNGNVFIAHSLNNTSGYSLGGIVCQINGTIITHGTDVILNSNGATGNAISSVLLDNGNIFIAHSYGSSFYLYAQIFGIDEANNIPTNNVTLTEYETQVRPATSLPCNGVASTSGVGGDSTGHKDMVSVYKPFVKIFTSNIIPNVWEESSDGLTATATNEYGEWEIVASGVLSSSYGVSKAFNGQTFSDNSAVCWVSQSLGNDDTAYIQINCPSNIRIKPMEIWVEYAACSSVDFGNTLQGCTHEGVWENIASIPKCDTDQTAYSYAISLSKDNYYSSFRLNVGRYSSTNDKAKVYEFCINSGVLQIQN